MKIIYIVLQITEDGIVVEKITRTSDNLKKYNDYYHIIESFVYKGKYILLNDNKGVRFKSFISQLLTMYNSYYINEIKTQEIFI